MSVYPEKEKQDIIPIETGYQMHRWLLMVHIAFPFSSDIFRLAL